MIPFRLPEGFLLGASTAATQIEGGDRNNNWYEWCRLGRIRDGTSCFRGCDHWNRFREDIGLMQKMHLQVYRMGLEWSRIEPENGRFSEEAVAHYREEISGLLRAGIRPLVTLHHFTHPLWFCREGEFESPKAVEYFLRYTRFVVERLGDLVGEFITINEPNIYIGNGYLGGGWPPGKKSPRLALRVCRNIALCHIGAYRLIHEIRREKGFSGETKVGVANHVCLFVPYHRASLPDRAAAFALNRWMVDGVASMLAQGKAPLLLRPFVRLPRGRYYDFIGVNYYQRRGVRALRLKDEALPGVPKNDLGWEIYPEGLDLCCRRYYKLFRAPVWVTENGVCDNEDRVRARFIAEHLAAVCRAAGAGVPVERYYHWSVIDNFEWGEGESARFGLIRCDYATQRRTVKESGRIYGEICKAGGVTEEIAREIDSPPRRVS